MLNRLESAFFINLYLLFNKKKPKINNKLQDKDEHLVIKISIFKIKVTSEKKSISVFF